MNTKAIFTIIALLIFMVSCKDTETREDQNTLNTEENEFSPVDRNIPREGVDNIDIDNDEVTPRNSNNTENSQDKDPIQNDTGDRKTLTGLTGQFIKVGEESDSNCGCYCVDLSSNTAELCLVNGKMYVNTRLQKNSNNTIDIFLVEPAARNTDGKEMPWKDFDRNSPIATIKPKSNGELELDWLGFKINGDLAVDYAIFGKKTLEGDYKKK
ncbi:MAG TPA: hypothetical protein VLN46_06835 [Gillisia sp.]|nr:hypothetical protein [Gillisia sp.]